MYVLAQVLSACTDRDRDPLLMYELAVFPVASFAVFFFFFSFWNRNYF